MKRLRILQDECAESPRNMFDNLGTITGWHRNYDLSDNKAKFVDPEVLFINLLADVGIEFHKGTKANLFKQVEKHYIILPLYMYEHSGVALSTIPFSCQWDSGQVGYIYVSKAKVREEFKVRNINSKLLNDVVNCLDSEVETYNEYINGDCYGFILEDEDGVEIDSCWGYFGRDYVNNGILDSLPSEIREEGVDVVWE